MKLKRLGALAAALAAPVLLAPIAAAQAPKPGKEYVDTVDLGFKIKMPDGWDFVPPQPNEVNTIGKFSGGSTAELRDPKTGRGMMVDAYLLKFDRRAKPEEPAEGDQPVFRGVAAETVDKWVESNLGPAWKKTATKELTVGKVAATRFDFTGSSNDFKLRACAFVYKLLPEAEVAALFVGPDDDKKWGKYESAYESMAKSFKPVEVTTVLDGPRSSSLRDTKRHELQKKVAGSQGWQLYETPNYFVVSSKNDDAQFIEELLGRLEAIREVYETLYPPALAEELRALAKARKAAEPPPSTPEEDAPSAEDLLRTVARSADPMELSRCSVVRLCKSREEYSSYGGPGGSAGYWSWVDQELVLYDDQALGGRRNTWAVLNHEAFHQYVFYFFGQLSPHSWYNEGTGDYFSGYEYKHKKFTLKAFDWRQRLIQENIRKDHPETTRTIAPLKEIVRWTQRQYYGDNDYGLDGGDNYAQGWSFIYFLRTGKKSCKCWNPAWDSILDVYLRTLVETDDLDTAVDRAFAGIDWDELEKCWKEYTLQG